MNGIIIVGLARSQARQGLSESLFMLDYKAARHVLYGDFRLPFMLLS